MVKLAFAKSTNAAFYSSQPLVVVSVAGSAGIGAFTLRQLAISHGKSKEELRVYLVARNEEVSKAILAECRQVCPHGDFRFIKAKDVSLLKDVDQCCNNIKESEGDFGDLGRVDVLIMSQGLVHFGGRLPTEEGIDKPMSLLYYSRIRFIVNLLPLLLKSQLPAHVISIYAAGSETWGTLHADDLSLRKPGNYSFAAVRTNAVHMKTMAFERLAREHPGKLSITHVYPWIVVHDGFYSKSHPWWFQIIFRIVAPLVKLVGLSHEEIGQRVLFFASSNRYPARSMESISGADVATSTDNVLGGGAYSCNYDGEIIDVKKSYTTLRQDGFPERVWNHTMEAFTKIDEGEQFTG